MKYCHGELTRRAGDALEVFPGEWLGSEGRGMGRGESGAMSEQGGKSAPWETPEGYSRSRLTRALGKAEVGRSPMPAKQYPDPC